LRHWSPDRLGRPGTQHRSSAISCAKPPGLFEKREVGSRTLLPSSRQSAVTLSLRGDTPAGLCGFFSRLNSPLGLRSTHRGMDAADTCGSAGRASVGVNAHWLTGYRTVLISWQDKGTHAIPVHLASFREPRFRYLRDVLLMVSLECLSAARCRLLRRTSPRHPASTPPAAWPPFITA
jgi:hypothetical protein